MLNHCYWKQLNAWQVHIYELSETSFQECICFFNPTSCGRQKCIKLGLPSCLAPIILQWIHYIIGQWICKVPNKWHSGGIRLPNWRFSFNQDLYNTRNMQGTWSVCNAMDELKIVVTFPFQNKRGENPFYRFQFKFRR